MYGLLHAVLCACALLTLSSNAQLIGNNTEYRPDTCLDGSKHEANPIPAQEGADYKECKLWKDKACCTAEFTQQLAAATVTNIDGYHWNRCGNLSQSCQVFFIRVECFYRCSPNVAHWMLEEYSALANLPVCREFCNAWYAACKNDKTCIENWITDWNYTAGSNHCPTNVPCRLYSEVYGSGEGICNKLWGRSFFYSNYSKNDEDRQCLQPWWPKDQPNPNTQVIEQLFGGTDGGSDSCPRPVVMLLLVTLLNMAAVIVSL